MEAIGKAGGDTRWWEQYYVRYFVGTVVGVAIIYVLGEKAFLHCDLQKMMSSLDKAEWLKLPAIAAAGLAYCYIASAPVLTLHALRGGLHLDSPKAALILLCSFVGIFVGLQLVAWGVWHWSGSAAAFGRVLVGVIVLAQLGLIALAQWVIAKINTYYDGLVKARFVEGRTGSDYRDSYRHLREHGNAKTIIILEIVLGVILAGAESATEAVIVLVSWLLPGAYAWFIGSMLEAHFVTEGGEVRGISYEFLKSKLKEKK